MGGSRISNTQSKSSNRRIALSPCVTIDSESLATDKALPSVDSHLKSSDIPNRIDINRRCVAIRTSVGQHRSVGEETTLIVNAVDNSSATSVSLADQYLDTMIMDDVWRAACLRKIRQNQRTQRALKHLNVNSTKQLQHTTASSNHPKRPSKLRSNTQLKSKIVSSDSAKKKSRKLTSHGGSDSGFVSSSPTPGPPTYLSVRSTRSYPVQTSNTTISIDVPSSAVGRSCLSCGCTNTTCWRRTLGGIICNSCGLR